MRLAATTITTDPRTFRESTFFIKSVPFRGRRGALAVAHIRRAGAPAEAVTSVMESRLWGKPSQCAARDLFAT
jgi:hypothetical protein